MRSTNKRKIVGLRKYQVFKSMKEFRFTYKRVRITNDKYLLIADLPDPTAHQIAKMLVPVDGPDVIEYPDLEMWAIYNPKGELVCLHLDEDSASIYCFNRTKAEYKVKRNTKSN